MTTKFLKCRNAEQSVIVEVEFVKFVEESSNELAFNQLDSYCSDTNIHNFWLL